MKKILISLIVLLIIIIPNTKVYALEDSFYEGEYIPGEYMKKFRNGSGKYQQFRFFRRKSDNQIVYCIQLWETLSSNKTITGYDNEQYNYANIDYSVWERIMLISYYGYGYENHTDSKWYVITQFMIWQATSPDTNIYFTDTLNGNKIEKYKQEINEINGLIENHSKLPSFYNQTRITRNKVTTTVKDLNNVLDRFEILNSGGTQITKNENDLVIYKDTSGKSQIQLINSGKRFQSSPIVYIDNDGQNVLAPGNYNPIYAIYNLIVLTHDIIVNKLDLDTNSNIPQGDAKLEGTKIQLIDKDNIVVAEATTKEDGTIIFKDIPHDIYYLKEVESGSGYLLNTKPIEVKLLEENITVNIHNQVIKNEIIINKYLRNPLNNNIVIEQGAVFSIFNSKNEKIITLNTNNEGIAKVTLPYGKYKIKQESGTINYSYIKDFEIFIREDGIIQNFDLYSEQLTTDIKIVNIDNDSRKPILEKGAQFKIKNLETNQYLKTKEGKDLILETNELGVTDFLTITTGKYQIEQIKVIDGYSINNEIILFEFNEATTISLDDNNTNCLEFKISNNKQKAQIEIEKYTEYYLNDNLVEMKKEMNLSVPIYANEDIYSKDGIKLYAKDEKVEVATLKDEKVITPLLVFGSYYLKNPIDNTIINIILNKTESQRIELIDKVYEYEEINESSNEDNLTIVVPDTLTQNKYLSCIGITLIGIGLLIIRKVKKYENN